MAPQNKIIKCTEEQLTTIMAEERARGVQQALMGIKSVNATGYFSTVRFGGTTTRAAGPPATSTLTIAQGVKRSAFSYGIGGDMATAGYPGGTIATLRHTNLSEAKKTRDGETYLVTGIALHTSPVNDAFLQALVWQNASMLMTVNTNVTVPLGFLGFFPAIAGLHGKGSSLVEPPPLQSAGPTPIDVLGNGGTMDPGCYFVLPEESPIIWRPSGNTDSSLTVDFSLPGDIVIGPVEDRLVAPGVQAWQLPATGAPYSFVDVTIRLVGRSIAEPSQNQLRAHGPRATVRGPFS